ncbi:hypothetical protein [Curtobacterium aurantiacum]|uniref:hypothetical protein n=1 Tax=Curtobacterium aurantiacum TaxID=3236919 RepID=UPI001BDEB58D|nr:hypothetical protein [Curtobacterium flaccumfaciens]MBT1679489.1 hypothetical protein [Curtobacterium flaccumfaciens pv. flaccumfaciens]
MSITSRITTAGTATVIVVLVLSGCAGTGTAAPGAERATPRSSAPTQAPAPAPTETETPTAPATADSATKDLTFEDGDALSASTLPAFGLEISALDDWEQTGEDPTTGSREYTNADGSVATITQQRLTDLDPTIGDRAATEQLFTAAGLPADRLEEQLLPTITGGTAQFLSIAGRNTDGSWSATVARAFAKPGAALIVKIRTTSQDALRPDLHDILVNAQVVVA